MDSRPAATIGAVGPRGATWGGELKRLDKHMVRSHMPLRFLLSN